MGFRPSAWRNCKVYLFFRVTLGFAMSAAQGSRSPDLNTVAMLGRAYSLLGFQIVDGVVGAGFPQKPSHSAVFAQIKMEGSRLTDLARGANITPQAMGELVDELEELGYVERRPDPTDRRAKLIVLTDRGKACIAAGISTIDGIEDRITQILGERGRRQLRSLLGRLLDAD
jgi:DNA-binding MarR family transcriptional regulator